MDEHALITIDLEGLKILRECLNLVIKDYPYWGSKYERFYICKIITDINNYEREQTANSN